MNGRRRTFVYYWEEGQKTPLYELCSVKRGLTLPKREILYSSKLKEYADDDLKYDEKGRNYSKPVLKHCGKRRNCSL